MLGHSGLSRIHQMSFGLRGGRLGHFLVSAMRNPRNSEAGAGRRPTRSNVEKIMDALKNYDPKIVCKPDVEIHESYQAVLEMNFEVHKLADHEKLITIKHKEIDPFLYIALSSLRDHVKNVKVLIGTEVLPLEKNLTGIGVLRWSSKLNREKATVFIEPNVGKEQ